MSNDQDLCDACGHERYWHSDFGCSGEEGEGCFCLSRPDEMIPEGG